MGYESRLYVVEKSSCVCEEDMRYGEVIAMFNLCKVPTVARVMHNYPPTDTFIYDSSGNDKILEDCYGESLKEIPLGDAVEIIETAMQEEDYRRFLPCYVMLKSLQLNKNHWREIVVLHYGY